MMSSKRERILLISNYQRGVGGINAQVDLLHTYLNQEEEIWAEIFSTKGHPFRRLWQVIKLLWCARDYDVLHIHACSYWGMVPAVAGVVAGKLWRKRIIITYHGGEAGAFLMKNVSWVSRWLKRADEVIVLSGFLKAVFDRYDIPCVVIPNIVVLQPQQKRECSIAPKFISIRHLESLYNIPCILLAYEQVLKHYPESTLDILGKGSMREELEAFVEEHQLTGVTFVGQVPNQQIYDYLAKADIMLSAPKIDNMPVSLLEAMNAGLLVISSRVGGVPYMINEVRSERLKVRGNEKQLPNSLIALSPYRLKRPTGLLFESNNANDLAEKMLWALEHPAEMKQIIAQAQKDVQKYAWDNVKQQLIKIYKNE